jgi:hypothetical protein
VHQFDPLSAGKPQHVSLMGLSLILALVAGFCFKEASRLWGRFDFESTLTWVEVLGNYQTSRIGTGNQLTSRMNTQNDVVRTESMTLRVWRARIESVVFGKDGQRQITAMFSTDHESQRLSERLMSFARGQSVLVAAGSAEDQARLQALNLGEQALLSSADPGLQHLAHSLTPSIAGPAEEAPRTLFCSNCGHRMTPAGRFCSQCGHAFSLPQPA